MAGQVATTLLSILLNAQLGRTLGPAEFGLYFFLLNSTYFVHVFIEWGQGSILLREIAKRPSEGAVLLGSAILIRVALCVPALLLGTAIAWLLGYEPRTNLLLAATIVAWLPTVLVQTYGLALRGNERMDLDARATVFNKSLHVGMVTAAFAMGGRLVSVIVSLGLSGLAALWFTARQARSIGFEKLRFESSAARFLLRAGFPVLLMGILTHAQVYLDTLLISSLASAEVLGWFGAARSITNTLIMPASILLTASYPRFARASTDPAALREEFAAALRPVLVLGALVATGTALFADVAIGLIYGISGYGPSVTILQAGAPLLFLIFLTFFSLSLTIIVDRAKEMAAIRTAVIAATAVAAWYLIPIAQERWGNGALGAILASTCAELLLLAVSTAFLPRGVLRLRMLGELLRVLLCAGLAAATVLVAPIDTPFLTIPLFLFAFGLLALATRLVVAQDLRTLRDALGRRFSRG